MNQWPSRSEPSSSISPTLRPEVHPEDARESTQTAGGDGSMPEETIGTAEISEDGTIILTLRASGGGLSGDARLSYPRSDPRYEEILRHVGPLKPGERKPVKPFP